VLLGETYSWSEANWDEKAFTVLRTRTDPGAFQRRLQKPLRGAVQLIDLNRDMLVARAKSQVSLAFAERHSTVIASWRFPAGIAERRCRES